MSRLLAFVKRATSVLLLSAIAACCLARAADIPASTPGLSEVPELSEGFRLLYTQHFPEARSSFHSWADAHPGEPFPQAAIAASYLFEELYRQGVLTSDFFLNEKRFLHGIEGKPNAERMKDFRGALTKLRMRIQAGADRRAADCEIIKARQGCVHPTNIAFQ